MNVDINVNITFFQIADGFVTETEREFFYGDQARVQCLRGFRLLGSPLITCGDSETFENNPTCEGKY